MARRGCAYELMWYFERTYFPSDKMCSLYATVMEASDSNLSCDSSQGATPSWLCVYIQTCLYTDMGMCTYFLCVCARVPFVYTPSVCLLARYIGMHVYMCCKNRVCVHVCVSVRMWHCKDRVPLGQDMLSSGDR